MKRIIVVSLILALFPAAAYGQDQSAADKVMALAVKKSQTDAQYLADHFEVTPELSITNLVTGLSEKADESDKDDSISILDMFGKGRYSYRSIRTSQVDSVPAYAISFEPGESQPDPPGFPHEHAKILGEVLNNLTGMVYVCAADFAIMKVEARLTHGVGDTWFHVYQADPIVIKQLPQDRDGRRVIWGPTLVTFTATYKPFWSAISRKRRDYTFQYDAYTPE